MSLLASLNPKQQDAVTHTDGHTLILAGAGSGKTKVLVHRMAWLIDQGFMPESILAVTFTNKAAKEMRERVSHTINTPFGLRSWIGTFHGLCHRLLRQHHQEAGLIENFQILDQDDQLRLIRKIIKTCQLDEKKWPPRQIQLFIQRAKEQGQRAKDCDCDTPYSQQMSTLYGHYESYCKRSYLVDFTELLLACVELLSQNDSLRDHYQQRFSHILIDEFQDTNQLQYRWIKLLAGPSTHIMAVGDDDQSIYSWRGAKIQHMFDFTHDFDPVDIIKLEQNYRSTQTILEAANQVIQHNDERHGKTLWSEQGKGSPLLCYHAYHEMDEAQFIARHMQQHERLDHETAILYRANAQSRALEETLNRAGIAYKIYGGLRFFERAEIKDALAYLRLMVNRHDDAAFERVVNLPQRGIGQTTLTRCREYAHQRGVSLWECVLQAPISTRAATALHHFKSLIDTLDQSTQGLPLSTQCETMLESSGLLAYYTKQDDEKGLSKKENLLELLSATQAYDQPSQGSPLTEFLAHTVLDTGDDDTEKNVVQMMTLHAAKGLEFETVYLTGMEEGLFPHQLAVDNQLEEERRLCYVGLTRAKKNLILTHAEHRRQHGRETYQRPSRFIDEINPDLIDFVRPHQPQQTHHFQHPSHTSPSTSTPLLQLGQAVRHPSFGDGVILNAEGQGEHLQVQVRFQSGVKWLLYAQAPLSLL